MNVLSTAVTLLIALAAVGYGAAVAGLLKLGLAGALERLCITLGLGAGIISAAIFWIGVAGRLGAAAFLVLLAPAAAYGVVVVAQTIRKQSASSSGAPSFLASWTGRGALAVIAICAFANLIGALAPPTFADALIYHLFVPAQYLEHGGIFEVPAVWQHYSPMAVEMLYTAAQGLAGPKASGLIGAGLGLFAAAATALLGRRLAGPVAGVIAAAMFYGTAMVAWQSTSCFVDLGPTALVTLSLYALLRWDDSRNRGWLIAAALLAGFAAACKLNAATFAVIACLVVGYLSIRQGATAMEAIGRVVLFGGIAAMTVIPWSVRSLILTGNPVYPFATGLFGENPDRAAIEWVFQQYGVGYSLLDRLLAPWHLLVQGAPFENGQHLNPLPMLMAPVIFLRARADRQRLLVLVVATTMFAIWAAGAHVARYMQPLLPLACVLAADALCWLGSSGGRRRAMAVAVGGAFLLLGCVNTLLYDKQFMRVAMGREAEEQYLRRVSWYYDVLREVCAGLPAGGRILTNSQQPTYYLNCPHARARDVDFDDPAHLRQLITDGKFTHVLLLGNESLETRTAKLAPDVRQVWQRKVDVLVSRTFGRTAKQSVALFEVNRR